MAIRRSRKLPSAVGRSYELTVDSFGWKQIEAAYGEKLSIPARLHVAEATLAYVNQTSFENNAQPVQLASDRIKELEKAANIFRAVLTSHDEQRGDAYMYGRSYGEHEYR